MYCIGNRAKRLKDIVVSLYLLIFTVRDFKMIIHVLEQNQLGIFPILPLIFIIIQ